MIYNFNVVLFAIAHLVSSHVYGTNLIGEKHSLNHRCKRQEKWSWGYVNEGMPLTTTQNTTTKSSETEENPCDPYNSIKPDFSAPGRRISEAKCYEYIWYNNDRNVRHKRFRACIEYKRKRRPMPNFAIGGRNTLYTEFPHMGAVGWKSSVEGWVFLCGSTLISTNFVLTAAHCTRASPRDSRIADTVPKIIRFGSKNLFLFGYSLPLDINIKRIIVHPSYKPPGRYNDIALMELDTDVTFNKNTQPACLWGNFDTSALGTKATLTGWGVKAENSNEISPELQAADVDIIDTKTCDDLLRPSRNRHWCGVEDHQLCAGKLSGGVDACQGDSGGPLQVKIPLPTTEQGLMHRVIGITSFGVGCARANRPGVYTRVSSFIDWIEDNVWK